MRVGNLVIGAGVVLVLIGIAIRVGIFSWFGHLPGDIRVEGERSSFFFPITSSIVLSVALTVVLSLIARLFRGQ
jgi:membrane protein implicated in regulation of membrane protease activity